ncbi:hypothetical protein ACFQLX_19030 [Streptomyces polyrhachis]|uniref:Transcriptional regulator, AbiEi antitoxin, Type IV TA system n=1 Tax=Streptomyces polyrhachis TaxID=1282885 RepID=A0ABW2GHI6_9ACTN
MNHETPHSPRTSSVSCNPLPLSHLGGVRPALLTAHQLREHGVSAAVAERRCRPGGPWQQLLPGVYLLHSGAPTGWERLHSALLYAGRADGAVPRQGADPESPGHGPAMLTGMAALALHGFADAPRLPELAAVDVLLPRERRLRSTGHARLVRAHTPPAAEEIAGLPVAPAPRALADAVARLRDASLVRRLLVEAVRAGHCDAASLVRELAGQRLLDEPHVAGGVAALLAEGRSRAEELLYAMVRLHELPDPLWQVDLRLPGGPHLGGLDAYWPEYAVALELDCRTPGAEEGSAGDALWEGHVAKRETLERLGITVVHVTPRKLGESMGQQAEVVRAALLAAAEREPSAYVVVLPQ